MATPRSMRTLSRSSSETAARDSTWTQWPMTAWASREASLTAWRGMAATRRFVLHQGTAPRDDWRSRDERDVDPAQRTGYDQPAQCPERERRTEAIQCRDRRRPCH